MAEDRVKWRGADQLRPLLLPIADVIPWPGNPRRGDAARIAASLRRWGQMRAGLVQRSSMQIVAGNHATEAAEIVGWTHYAYVVADLDDADAEALLIADNRLAELGGYDQPALAATLDELRRANNLDGTGYTDVEVERVLAELEGSRIAASGAASFTQLKTCPNCGHEWT